MPGNGLLIIRLMKNNLSRISKSQHHCTVETGFIQEMYAHTCRNARMFMGLRIIAPCVTREAAGGLSRDEIGIRGSEIYECQLRSKLDATALDQFVAIAICERRLSAEVPMRVSPISLREVSKEFHHQSERCRESVVTR